MIEAQDKDGRPVKVGSKVRIIELAPHFLASLPDDEERDVRSMIGEILRYLKLQKVATLLLKRNGILKKKVAT